MNIASALASNSLRIPEKTAIIYEDRSYTYKEFNEIVNRFANGLIELGVNKGDKVSLMMKNSDFFAISYLACAKAGAIIVPFNFSLVEREVVYILDQSDSTFVICDQDFEDLIQASRKKVPAIRQVITVEQPKIEGNLSIKDALSENSGEPNNKIKSTDDLHILYTSGTTGNPKGALFDHQRVEDVIISCMGLLGYSSEEKFIHNAPLFHAAQLMICLLPSIYIGGLSVIQRNFTPESALRDIEKYKITTLFAVPTMYKLIVGYEDNDKYDVSSLKSFMYGAAPMSASEVNKCMDFFQSRNFYSLCGLTEAGPSGIFLSPEDHEHKVGAAGKHALLFSQVKLVNADGEETKTDEVGELIYKSNMNMKEYYKKPKETAETLIDGWLYTGDLAMKDEDGYMYVVDRSKDMIITGGMNVYSVEVENVLIGHSKIADVAIVGTPDEKWGEIVTAVIVKKPDVEIDLDELNEFSRKELSSYKIPRKLIFKDVLPRNASGKLKKFELREEIKHSHKESN